MGENGFGKSQEEKKKRANEENGRKLFSDLPLSPSLLCGESLLSKHKLELFLSALLGENINKKVKRTLSYNKQTQSYFF